METRVQTQEQVNRVHNYLSRAIESGPKRVTVEDWEPEGTVSQKLKLFAMCDNIADSLGYDRKPFRRLVEGEWGPVERVTLRKAGEVREVPKSFHDYTKDEASAMIERLNQFVAETPEAKLKEKVGGVWQWTET